MPLATDHPKEGNTDRYQNMNNFERKVTVSATRALRISIIIISMIHKRYKML